MWIKVKTENDRDAFVNADKVETIFPFNDEHGQGCKLYFNSKELPLPVKTTSTQLDMLLYVNSIEKCFDRLEVENMQLRQQMQYDKIHDEVYGARAKKG